MFPSISHWVCYSTDWTRAFRVLWCKRGFCKRGKEGQVPRILPSSVFFKSLCFISVTLWLFCEIDIREVIAKSLNVLDAMLPWQRCSRRTFERKLHPSAQWHESLGVLQLKSNIVTCPALQRHEKDTESTSTTLATALILSRAKQSTLYCAQLERYQLRHFNRWDFSHLH